MINSPPITINNTEIYCVYALEIQKQDKISTNESESGDEILYLIRKNNYTLKMSFKCNALIGNQIDNAVTSNVLLAVKFVDKGMLKTATMRVTDYSYSCITMCGAEIWDIQLSLTESVRYD